MGIGKRARDRWGRILMILAIVYPLAWFGPRDFEFLSGAVPIEVKVVVAEEHRSAWPFGRQVRVQFVAGGVHYRYGMSLGPLVSAPVGTALAALFNPEVAPYLKQDNLWSRYRFVPVWLGLAALVLVAVLVRRLRRPRGSR